MRSLADRTRRALRIEGLLRGAALAAIVAAAVAALWVLRRTREGEAPLQHVELSDALTARTRDSLAALARSGHTVTWSGPVAPVAAAAEALREPLPRWRIAAVGDAALALRDSLGLLDSLATDGTLSTDPTRGPVHVWNGSTVALANAPSPRPPRAALVLGRVGWEPRFAITALEEAGWTVDARLTLGRDRAVRQGDASPRRARHDIVLVFDSATAQAAATDLLRFLRDGGGVLLAGSAAVAPGALRAVAAARVLREEPPETRDFSGHEATHALPLFALTGLRADAVLLEDREGTPAIVARRVGQGRLMQLGYAETWRWRMQGEGRSVEEHRTFWSRLAGAVADGDAAIATAPATADQVPRAAAVRALGPERPEARRVTDSLPRLPWWLGPIILLALVAEWASRRRRGAA